MTTRATLSDRNLVAALEECTIPKGEFHHEDHVRVAWVLLQDRPLSEVLPRYRAALTRFAEHHEAPWLYHETITWAFLTAINERIRRIPARSWTEFKRQNPDLIAAPREFLGRYYSETRLDSELARREFVLPDRSPAETDETTKEELKDAC